MIDLRSDTVTLPTEGMRAAMAAAPVGDDVYGEDPTVLELERRTAAMLGKEDAVFVPSGTMSNQLALRVHTRSGDVVLTDANAHILINEGGAPAALSGLTVQGLPGRRGIFTGADVAGSVEPPHPFNPEHLVPAPTLVCVENTHNVGGGSVWPLETTLDVAATAREMGMALHLDGARLWHAAVASSTSELDLAEPFDTVSVCFSKGLGAPVGSALAGTRDTVRLARRYKQMYGGGFRQAGIVAAGALYALDHHLPDLGLDIENAATLARGLAELPGISIDPAQVETNIVRFQVLAMGAGPFVEACHARGVHMLPSGTSGVRAVTHRDVSARNVRRALQVVAHVLESAP